jgi:hypothetical protein
MWLHRIHAEQVGNYMLEYKYQNIPYDGLRKT